MGGIRPGCTDPGELVENRQDFARAGRSCRGALAPIGQDDVTIIFVAGTTQEARLTGLIVQVVNGVQVRAQHIRGRANRADAARVEPDRATAHQLDRGQVVRNEHDRRLTTLAKVEHAPERPILERRVADRQHLVHQQDIRLNVHRD